MGAQFVLVEVVMNLSETETRLSSAKNVISGTTYIVLALALRPLWNFKYYSPSRNEQSNSTKARSDSSMLSTPTLNTSQNAGLIFAPNPQKSSTPERHKKTQGITFKGICINTNSIKSIEKATQLNATIQYNNPDISS